MHVDLHMHTTISDGVLTPTQLVDLVALNGVHVMALTDHDTTNGLQEAFAAAQGKRPTAFPDLAALKFFREG